MLGVGPPGPLQAIAFFLPFIAVISQARGDALFRTDAAVVAALGGSNGATGAFSSQLGRLAQALPLGDQVFRVALWGALFCALGGLSTLHLSYALFARQGGRSRLDPWLSVGASLAVAFSLPWFEEATLAGGSVIAAGLALTLFAVLSIGGLPRSVPGAGLSGLALGALFSESPWCGAILFLTLVFSWSEVQVLKDLGQLRGLPATQVIKARGGHLLKALTLLGCAGLSWAILVLPELNRDALIVTLPQAVEVAAPRPPTVAPWIQWISELGFLWCGAAIIAFVFSLSDRRPLYGLLLVVAADLIVPGGSLGSWTDSSIVDTNRRSLHLLSLAAVAPLGALGLRTLGETAHALRLFAARPLATMVAVVATASCLAGAEDSLRTLERTNTLGAQTWTDEALLQLPPGSLILTNSPSWGRRLLAAQATGSRPDLLVVPLDTVSTSGSIAHWLEQEPALEHLLRDLTISDAPSERALTRLVDKRPLFVEPNKDWDPRILEHLIPGAPLVQVSSHALAHSDRLAALDRLVETQTLVQSSCAAGITPDHASQHIFEEGLDSLAEILAAVRDRRAVTKLETLRGSEPGLPYEEQVPSAPVAQATP